MQLSNSLNLLFGLLIFVSEVFLRHPPLIILWRGIEVDVCCLWLPFAFPATPHCLKNNVCSVVHNQGFEYFGLQKACVSRLKSKKVTEACIQRMKNRIQCRMEEESTL